MSVRWRGISLSNTQLRYWAGGTTFKRGMQYARAGRVSVLEVKDREASFIVSGREPYHVWLGTMPDGLSFACTCPMGQMGLFCKHCVAAAVVLRDVLRQQERERQRWQSRLRRVLEKSTERRGGRRRSEALLFFLLGQRTPYYYYQRSTWMLKPVYLLARHLPMPWPEEGLSLEALGALFDEHPHLVQRAKEGSLNRLSVEAACLNVPPEIWHLARMMVAGTPSYGYYADTSIDSIGDQLALLARFGVPVFPAEAENPFAQPIRLSTAPLRGQVTLSQAPRGVRLTAEARLGDQTLTVESVEPISDKPPWVLLNRNVLAPVEDPAVLEWVEDLKKPVLIPPKEVAEFREQFLPVLAEQVPLDGDLVQWGDVEGEPQPRLYLDEEEGTLVAELRFAYGEYEVPYEKKPPPISIQAAGDGSWRLVRVHRQVEREQEWHKLAASARHGLKRNAAAPHRLLLRKRVHPLDFLLDKVPLLTMAGFEIYGEEDLKLAKVNRSQPSLSLNITSGIDWFDVQAVVRFGDQEVSLQEIRQALRKKRRYVKLADGSIGALPEEWLERYKHLFGLGEQHEDGLRFSAAQITLLDQLLSEADRARTDAEFERRRQRLRDFTGIQEHDLPQGFQGELRPYQKAGYNWLHFLHEYEFGGCLADDMGLGKTVQVLVFLLSLRERGHAQAADLIVVPRSLLANWQREVERFTPSLRVLEHFGPNRTQDVQTFQAYDLVLTTYGVMLRDIERLREYRFHYAVLDESQAIKNPLAKTSKAARLLNADHRLVMTGTPVENTTFELWSQFAFINPGLLGNLEYFKSEFGRAIEVKGDEKTARALRKMVYPFILRRTKDQVAPELPPRTERVMYCDMEPAQRRLYEKTRDQYRAMLLGLIEEEGLDKARMKVLEGLLRLRQICNHPRLMKASFRGDSGKFLMLMETLNTLREEGHKALVFSQFVQMLRLIRAALDEQGIPYAYLDGRTRKRQEQVDRFQNEPDLPFFLISLKAGGVGLNLTAADYVIHVDPWWNPAVEMQAADRAHRIGQDKPVFIYKLITRNSVEEKILQLQERKKALVQQLISTESSFFKALTPEDVEVLFT